MHYQQHIILLLLLILKVFTLKDDTNDQFIWHQKEKYYFPSIDIKMKVILEERCYDSLEIQKDNTILIPKDKDSIYVSNFPPIEQIVTFWKSMKKPIQMRVEPFLCDTGYSKKHPIFNNPTCQLPGYMSPSAPRCQTKYLKWICDNARMDINVTKPNYFIIPEADHAYTFSPPVPWLLTAKNAYVSMCGSIHASCGLIHTNANCKGTAFLVMGQAFKNKCSYSKLNTVDIKKGSNFTCDKGTPFSNDVVVEDRVFVLGEVDDTYVYHIHLEIMPRIIYHLDFIKNNPDIKISIGCDTKKSHDQTMSGLDHGLLSMKPIMELAGISMDRLIVHKHVYAKEVYFPMEGGCQDPVYNTWQILNMRKYFFDKLNITEQDQYQKKPVMMLMKRSSAAKHTRNSHDLVRQWSDGFADKMLTSLQNKFPRYRVVLFTDRNETLMKCFECQIRAFAEVDVLIGIHGAGLANIVYMKPNSAVIEIAPYGNDGRCLLGGGPFSRIAAVMAQNYMIHHPPHSEYKWITREMVSELNIERFLLHLTSFLASINR